jgi:hypothetical protein
MTTVAVMATPPQATDSLDVLADLTLGDEALADLYAAMLADVCQAVDASGADLLVNYRTVDELDDEEAAAAVRDAVEPALSSLDEVRFEPQVGSSFSARAGNTVTHLLEREGVRTAAVVTPAAVFLERTHVDSAAMKLRQAPVVIGPAPEGRVHYAAFAEPVDFTDAFESAPLETLAERGAETGFDVDFVEMLPVFERTGDLPTVLSTLRARQHAGHTVPNHTTTVIEDLGIEVERTDDGVSVTTD